MLRAWGAALCAAMAMTFASPAGATQMIAQLSGLMYYYHDGDLALTGPGAYSTGGPWSIIFGYDTERGQVTPDAQIGGLSLNWSSADGGPSPLEGAWLSTSLFYDTHPNATFISRTDDLSAATSFAVRRGIYGIDILLSGPGFSFEAGEGDFAFHSPGPYEAPGTSFQPDAAYGNSYFGRDDYGGHAQVGTFGTLDGLFLLTASITEAPAVPEPTTWALCIAGLFGIGIEVRRQSRRTSRRGDG
jgi:hypothetical protein